VIYRILIKLVKLRGYSRDNESASSFGTPDERSVFLKRLTAAQRQTGKTSKKRLKATSILADENRMER
jgi:hypothetical protein